MQETAITLLDRIRRKRALLQWDRLADKADTASPRSLRMLERLSRGLEQRVSHVMAVTNDRLGEMRDDADMPGLPPSTDWTHRPDPWARALRPAGFAPAAPQTPLAKGVTLYHDGKNRGIIARQTASTSPDQSPPFSLCIEIFDFDGSFLSLVIEAPPAAILDLAKTHILRVSLALTAEQPVEVQARLNLRHGPNTEQVSADFPKLSGRNAAEFDLAGVPFKETRAGQVWFDLFIESPPMNKMEITDLFLSRHRRAQI